MQERRGYIVNGRTKNVLTDLVLKGICHGTEFKEEIMKCCDNCGRGDDNTCPLRMVASKTKVKFDTAIDSCSKWEEKEDKDETIEDLRELLKHLSGYYPYLPHEINQYFQKRIKESLKDIVDIETFNAEHGGRKLDTDNRNKVYIHNIDKYFNWILKE